ncbi:MAG: hypothetical protein LBS54_09405 [Dysgonamonadaceae bacterium]|jgi:hypothetical protein|nr:hypothetical protein [Dysgonamonadaceae bacterium]
MKKRRKWIPTKHNELKLQAIWTINHITDPEERERLGFEESSARGAWLRDVLMPVFDQYCDAYVKWSMKPSRTSYDILRFYKAENEFKAVYKELYVKYIKPNPAVTNVDLISMGFPERIKRRKKPN